MADPLVFEPSYSTTDVNKGGARIYDAAWQKGGVEITRRGQRFVLMRRDYLAKLLDEARDGRPKSLDDLLRDYDAPKIKTLTGNFLADPATGKEGI